MNDKVKKALSVIVLEGLGYGLFLAMILIENYFIFLGLVLCTFGVILGLKKKKPTLYSNLKALLMENKKLSIVVLFLLLLTFPILLATNPYWIQVAVLVGLFVMMALGLNIMVGNAGLTCLGYAAFYAIGAYTYGILALRYGISFWLCIPIAIIVVMLFGFVLGLPALRVKGHYLALVTIAFGLVVYQLTINLENLTGGFEWTDEYPCTSLRELFL